MPLARPIFAASALMLSTAIPASAQMIIPSDAKPTCTVSTSEFDGWFAGGSPSAGGLVDAADSMTFPTDNTVCDFYKWGAQMFLWLTSPSGDGLILDSPAIFNVLPAENNMRMLQSNADNAPSVLSLRQEKNDATAAETIDTVGELGQAGSGAALMAQPGPDGTSSLVYYGVHVNDGYGYFLTGQKGGELTETVFPRNETDLEALIAYMSTAFPGVELVAPETLVMEFKTSWVEADLVADPSSFVTMEAVIPDFDTSGALPWTANGTRTTTLALTGIHIVGTVQNHPEFVWITYEHIANAPDANFWYTNSSDAVTEVAYDSSGAYTFMATGTAEADANKECLVADGDTIDAATHKSGGNTEPNCPNGQTVDSVYRQYPWGSESKNDTSIVDNNTQLIAINNSVISMIPSGDPRAQYALTAGIWTSAPTATSDAPIPDVTSGTPPYSPADLRGSLFAFNGTMETYTQGTSCFSCHQQSDTAPDSFQAFQLSHIYSQIQALTEGQ